MGFFLKSFFAFSFSLVLGSCMTAQTNQNDNPTSAKPADTGQKPSPHITAASFGFQCGTGKLTNCPNATWPTTVAQPGMIRLWDSQVQWHLLNNSRGGYNWRLLDAYLDMIATHQPRDAMYTFGYTPCWDTKGECERAWGSTYPPDDLTVSGSQSFNAFVTALVTHCSPAGHCVKDYVRYWELWNEANTDNYWHGTISQLYDLMAPAVPIIRARVPGALVLTPPVNRGDIDWMKNWLSEENKRGRLSDIYSFHLYLQGQTPESRFPTIRDMVDLKNSTPGWANTPWMNSETNFDAARFACSDRYGSDDCIGQMVRWHLLHFALGAQQVSWYFFNTTIGHSPELSSAYKTMMDWLVGGYFPSGCALNGNVITCPFVQANGHHALFAWTMNGETSYSPNGQYATFKALGGNATPIASGQKITLTGKPIMLEASN